MELCSTSASFCRTWAAIGICRNADSCPFPHVSDIPSRLLTFENHDDDQWWQSEAVRNFYHVDEQQEKVTKATKQDLPQDFGQNRNNRSFQANETQFHSIKRFKDAYNHRLRILNKVFHDRINSFSSSKGEHQLLAIWRSQFRMFVFADYCDPRVARPSRAIVDIIIRAIAILPAVIHLPASLQKDSIARALAMRFQKEHSSAYTTRWLAQSKQDVFRFVLRSLNTWSLLTHAFTVAAPILTLFVGQDTLLRKGDLETQASFVWKGFDFVFQDHDFWEEFLRFRDPKRLLQPIIERCEMKSRCSWIDFSQSFAIQIHTGTVLASELNPFFSSFIVENEPSLDCSCSSVSDRMFNLLWRCFQILLDFRQISELCCDWLCGGIQRRLTLLSVQFPSVSTIKSQVTLRKPQATQRLLMLFATGVYKHLHGKNKVRKTFDTEEQFVEAIFRTRIRVTQSSVGENSTATQANLQGEEGVVAV
jgi:hypothetical protein